MKKSLFKLSDNVRDLPVFESNSNILIDNDFLGTWAFITEHHELLSKIKFYYGLSFHNNLILKIWQYPIYSESISQLNWGRYFNLKNEESASLEIMGSLLDNLRVQNFAAKFNLAPKIYGIFVIKTASDSRHIGILTENAFTKCLPNYITGDENRIDHMWKSLEKFSFKYNIQLPWKDLCTKNHFINDMLVDWQGAKFLPTYNEFLSSFFLENTCFGESKYQTVPDLEISEGIRDSVKRISDLGLNRFDFSGASVLDIGCNGGQFLNYTATNGARFGIGIDWPKVIEAADYLSNFFGHFNIRYLSSSLHIELPELEEKFFDYCFFFSMVTHVGVPDYLKDISKVLLVEVNHPHQVEGFLNSLESSYWIEFWGKSSDHGDRNIFHCFNKKVYQNPPCQDKK